MAGLNKSIFNRNTSHSSAREVTWPFPEDPWSSPQARPGAGSSPMPDEPEAPARFWHPTASTLPLVSCSMAARRPGEEGALVRPSCLVSS